eukprot:403347574
MNYRNYTPQENEFFAENELIPIIPKFKEESFSFVGGTYGPFRPAKPVVVPIWLAIYLKSRGRCQVQLPKWLDYDHLKRVKAEEMELSIDFSSEIPYYYYEIATLLFNNCSDEFSINNGQGGSSATSGVQRVKSIIEDIQELRREKLLRMLKNIDPVTPVKYLGTCGSVEINQIRPSFTTAYSIAHQMQNIVEKKSDPTENQ